PIAARIVLIVTDDLPHYEGDAQLGIDWWNPNSGVEPESPHFWSPEFINTNLYYPNDSPAIYDPVSNGGNYIRLLELNDKAKQGQALPVRNLRLRGSTFTNSTKNVQLSTKNVQLSDDERKEYDDLLKLLGPANFPNAKPHPGTMEAAANCGEYEYPSLAQVGKAMTDAGIVPLVLVSEPDYVYYESSTLCAQRGFGFGEQDKAGFVNCARRMYEEDFKNMNLTFYKTAAFSKNAEQFVTSIKDVLDQMTASFDCNPPTPPPVPGDCPTAVAPVPVIVADDSHRLSSGAVAGVTVGASAGVGLLFGALGYALRAWTNRGNAPSSIKDVGLDVDARNVTVNRDVTQILQADMFQ
ncbi:putative transmembrane protein, partial [Gregarina niphandrodes]